MQNNVKYLPQQPNNNIEQNNIPNLDSLEHQAVEQSVNRNNNIPQELIPQQTQQPRESNFKENNIFFDSMNFDKDSSVYGQRDNPFSRPNSIYIFPIKVVPSS